MISRDNALVQMGWTKEETDYLLDMLEQYDLRFVVVADRYNVSERNEQLRGLAVGGHSTGSDCNMHGGLLQPGAG